MQLELLQHLTMQQLWLHVQLQHLLVLLKLQLVGGRRKRPWLCSMQHYLGVRLLRELTKLYLLLLDLQLQLEILLVLILL